MLVGRSRYEKILMIKRIYGLYNSLCYVKEGGNRNGTNVVHFQDC